MAYDPNDPEVQRQVASGQLVFNPSSGQIEPRPQGAPAGTYYTAPNQNPQVATAQIGSPTQAQFNANQNLQNAQQAQIGASGNVINAQQGVIPLQQAQIGAQQQANQAQAGVLQAQAGTFGPQQGVIDANGQVISANEAYIRANQGFIGQQQQANTASLADQQAIQNARGNVQDQVNVARWEQEQNDLGKRYQAAGVSAPIRVNVSPDQQGGQTLAPGVIANVRTQESKLIDMAQIREAQRTGQLKGAQLSVSLIGTNVDMARQAAARAGLTLDQAQLLVSKAQNTAGFADLNVKNAGLAVDQANIGVSQARLDASRAGLGVDQARLDLSRSGTPPQAGMVPVVNPITGIEESWGTPTEAAAAKAQYERNFGNSQAGTRYSTHPLFGALSNAQILGGVTDGSIYRGDAIAELTRRGYTQDQATLIVDGARPRDGAGGGPVIQGPGFGSTPQTATTQPVSGPSATYNQTAQALGIGGATGAAIANGLGQ